MLRRSLSNNFVSFQCNVAVAKPGVFPCGRAVHHHQKRSSFRASAAEGISGLDEPQMRLRGVRHFWVGLSSLLVLGLSARANSDDLLHSIVFVTKRPGGYDLLLESLARQTDRNYELICVDELAPYRAHKVKDMAKRLNVNLLAVTTSKPKTTRFGIANAFNTGFVLSSGAMVTILQDNIYLPADFVEKTLAFHRDHPNALLSYPEYRFLAPAGLVNTSFIRDYKSISVFNTPVTLGPRDQGWKSANEGTMPKPLWENMMRGDRIPFDWLECACCSIPYEVVYQLNGVDESLDTGDDCHEVNLKQRSQMIGVEVWNEGACAVQLVDHHRWERSELWTRFTRDTNIFRWDFMKQQMEFGEYPLRAPNNFDLFLFRTHHANRDIFVDGPTIRILAPLPGSVFSGPAVKVSFSIADYRMVPGSMICISIGLEQSFCTREVRDVELVVHRAGCHVLHVMLYSEEARVLAEAQTAFVQNVPAPVGELGRMAGAQEASTGWVKGESSTVPSGLEEDAVQEVFRKEHDLPKESMLFVFNKDPAHYDTWRDGLWAALRVVARHYNIQYLNVNDIVVAEKPEINYHLSPGTFKFILGWGAFGSPTDYFLTQIHYKHGDTHPKALCIGGNAVPPPAEATEVYDLLFFETEWYRETISFHPLIRQAFGINANIYHELPPKVDEFGERIWEYDVLMVGHFLPWKRHGYLVQKEGRKLAVGEIYQEYAISSEIVEQLQDAGVEVTNMLPPRELADLYRTSRLVFFPMATVGGGERALLEARACGAAVEVAEDNPKLQFLLHLHPIPDHHKYAEQLLDGINALLDKVGTRNVTHRPPMPDDETVVEQRVKELIRHTCKEGEYCPYRIDHFAEY